MVFTENRKKRVANILTDLGIIIFAASTVAPFFPSIRQGFNVILTIIGFIISLLLFVSAIIIDK